MRGEEESGGCKSFSESFIIAIEEENMGGKWNREERSTLKNNLNFSGTVTGSWDGEERAVPMIMPDSGDGEERVSIRLAADLLDNATQDEFSKKKMKKNLWKEEEEELDFRARIEDEKVIRTGAIYTVQP
ncbi:hypothetical protein D5086_000128 [Populus alba]|uniref:Uncharacterized protein n=1 Tax=Populus alba TaxID=43335 RepID=A0ACC4CW72_POPAL